MNMNISIDLTGKVDGRHLMDQTLSGRSLFESLLLLARKLDARTVTLKMPEEKRAGAEPLIKKYFRMTVDEDINYNGEYYVTLVYNLLNRDKLKTTIYDTGTVMVFGTPEEVQNFEAWMTILNSTQVKDPYDAKACAYYWGRYLKETECN